MFFRRKESTIDSKKIVTTMLSLILSDSKISAPVYLSEIKTEADANTLGIAPIVYIWNENRATGSFSVSVNGVAVAHLLESFVPKTHSLFSSIQGEIMKALSVTSRQSVVATCEQLRALPSDLFTR